MHLDNEWHCRACGCNEHECECEAEEMDCIAQDESDEYADARDVFDIEYDI